MTIKQNGGIFGRNPTFNDLTVEGTLTQTGSASFTQLGIDVSPPTEALHVNGNIILNDGSFGAGDSHNLILGDKNAYIQSTHGQPVNFGAYHGFVFGRATASNLTIATEQVRIDTDGLKFNGDTAAANALDDYEEGTWTPTIYGSSTAGSPTYSQQIGRYTKIGNKVIAAARIDISAIGGMTGNVTFGGLPFTAAASVNQDVHVAILKAKNVTSEDTAFCVFPYNSQTNLLARSVNKNSDTALNITSINSDAGFSFTITYQT